MNHKKITAIMMAATMGMGCFPLNVSAIDSYKEAEKAAVTKAIEDFCTSYAKRLGKNTDSVQNTSNIHPISS